MAHLQDKTSKKFSFYVNAASVDTVQLSDDLELIIVLNSGEKSFYRFKERDIAEEFVHVLIEDCRAVGKIKHNGA